MYGIIFKSEHKNAITIAFGVPIINNKIVYITKRINSRISTNKTYKANIYFSNNLIKFELIIDSDIINEIEIASEDIPLRDNLNKILVGGMKVKTPDNKEEINFGFSGLLGNLKLYPNIWNDTFETKKKNM